MSIAALLFDVPFIVTPWLFSDSFTFLVRSLLIAK